MLMVQAGISFVIWLALGIVLRRDSERLRVRLRRLSRSKLALLGSLGFFIGVAILYGGLLAASALGGLSSGGMTATGWLVVTVAGLAFVFAQVLSGGALVIAALGETYEEQAASQKEVQEEQTATR